jgi:hypothetical protein
VDISNELTKAEQLIRSGKLKEAKGVLRLVLSADKRNADAWYLASQCMPEPKAKAEALRRVLLIDPDHPRAKREFNGMNGIDILRPPSMANIPASPVVEVPTNPVSKRPSRVFLLGGVVSVILALPIIGIVLLSRSSASPEGAARIFIDALLQNDDNAVLNMLSADSRSQTIALCSASYVACLSKQLYIPSGTKDIGSVLLSQSGSSALTQVKLNVPGNPTNMCLNIQMQNEGGWKVVDSVGNLNPCGGSAVVPTASTASAIPLAEPMPTTAPGQPTLLPTVAAPVYAGSTLPPVNPYVATEGAGMTATMQFRNDVVLTYNADLATIQQNAIVTGTAYYLGQTATAQAKKK